MIPESSPAISSPQPEHSVPRHVLEVRALPLWLLLVLWLGFGGALLFGFYQQAFDQADREYAHSVRGMKENLQKTVLQFSQMCSRFQGVQRLSSSFFCRIEALQVSEPAFLEAIRKTQTSLPSLRILTIDLTNGSILQDFCGVPGKEETQWRIPRRLLENIGRYCSLWFARRQNWDAPDAIYERDKHIPDSEELELCESIARYLGPAGKNLSQARHQLVPIYFGIEDEPGWIVWDFSKDRKFAVMLMARKRDVPADLALLQVLAEKSRDLVRQGVKVGWFEPARRRWRKPKGLAEEHFQQVVQAIHQGEVQSLECGPNLAFIVPAEDLTLFGTADRAWASERKAGRLKILRIAVVSLMLFPLLLLPRLWRNRGLAIPISWQVWGGICLCTGIPLAGLMQVSQQYLQERREQVLQESFNELERLGSQTSEACAWARRLVESRGARFCEFPGWKKIDWGSVQKVKKSGVLPENEVWKELQAAAEAFRVKNNVTYLFLMDDEGALLSFLPNRLSSHGRQSREFEPLAKLFGPQVLMKRKQFRGKEGFVAGLLGMVIDSVAGSAVEIEGFLQNDRLTSISTGGSRAMAFFHAFPVVDEGSQEKRHVLLMAFFRERDIEEFMLEAISREFGRNGQIPPEYILAGTENQNVLVSNECSLLPDSEFPEGAPRTIELSRMVVRLAERTLTTGETTRQEAVSFQGEPWQLLGCRVQALNMHSLILLKPHRLIFRDLETTALRIRAFQILSAMMAIILALLAVRSFMQPVQKLSRGVDLIARGEYDLELNFPGRDEFVELAQAFNGMTKGLWERREMTRYLSQSAMKAVTERNTLLQGGRRVQATVLFSDIRGFTTHSESNSAEEIVALLNEYFSRVARIIYAQGGDIDKFIGDAVMAIFHPERDAHGNSSPEQVADSLRRAIRCGMEMTADVRQFSAERQARGLFPIGIGVGINTGDLIAGSVGAPGRMDFTVIGDTVNVASRLEGASKQATQTFVVVSADSFQLVKDRFVAVSLGFLKLKGKSGETEILEILEERAP